MTNRMDILIVKHGALGDVVRTSYFLAQLKAKFENLKIFWITSNDAYSILVNNKNIDKLCNNFGDLVGIEFDHIYSLDDEERVVKNVMKLKFKKISGALIKDGGITYSSDVSEWFDMGLLSKFGKERADKLKRDNTRSHGEIFKKIFNVNSVTPSFELDKELDFSGAKILLQDKKYIGINPFAGGRWPSKEIQSNELLKLINKLLEMTGDNFNIVLFGIGSDRLKNEEMKALIDSSRVIVADTDKSIQLFAYLLSKMEFVISTDSLAMHLSIAQGIKTIAVFAPTSSVEIDSFGLCIKITSTSEDYCSYSKICDNSSLTAIRIIECIRNHSKFFNLKL